MPGANPYPLYEAVLAGFEALGAGNPRAIRRAVLYLNLFFAAQQFECEGMKAVWLVGEDAVTFYDIRGELLRTVSLEEQPIAKAA